MARAPNGEDSTADHAVFGEFVRAYDLDMYRLSMSICGDSDTARDCTQAAWASAWRHRRDLRDLSKVRGWLLTIAANETKRALRRQRLRGLLERRHAGEGADAPSVERADLHHAISVLTIPERELLGLRYGLDLTVDDIALLLHLKPSGVRTRLRRLMARLRGLLADER